MKYLYYTIILLLLIWIIIFVYDVYYLKVLLEEKETEIYKRNVYEASKSISDNASINMEIKEEVTEISEKDGNLGADLEENKKTVSLEETIIGENMTNNESLNLSQEVKKEYNEDHLCDGNNSNMMRDDSTDSISRKRRNSILCHSTSSMASDTYENFIKHHSMLPTPSKVFCDSPANSNEDIQLFKKPYSDMEKPKCKKKCETNLNSSKISKSSISEEYDITPSFCENFIPDNSRVHADDTIRFKFLSIPFQDNSADKDFEDDLLEESIKSKQNKPLNIFQEVKNFYDSYYLNNEVKLDFLGYCDSNKTRSSTCGSRRSSCKGFPMTCEKSTQCDMAKCFESIGDASTKSLEEPMIMNTSNSSSKLLDLRPKIFSSNNNLEKPKSSDYFEINKKPVGNMCDSSFINLCTFWETKCKPKLLKTMKSESQDNEDKDTEPAFKSNPSSFSNGNKLHTRFTDINEDFADYNMFPNENIKLNMDDLDQKTLIRMHNHFANEYKEAMTYKYLYNDLKKEMNKRVVKESVLCNISDLDGLIGRWDKTNKMYVKLILRKCKDIKKDFPNIDKYFPDALLFMKLEDEYKIDENLIDEDIENAVKNHRFVELEEIENFIRKFK